MALGARGERIKDRDGQTHFLTDQWPLATPFGETLSARRIPIINLTRIDAYHDEYSEINGATLSADGRSVSTGTNGGGRFVARTKERFQYQDGTVGEWAQFKQFDRELAGGEFVEYLAGDGDNQFGYRFDSTGPALVIDQAGTRVLALRQSGWNVDAMDGSGGKSNPSGLNLSGTTRDVLYTHLTWYGAGPIQFYVQAERGNKRFLVKVHEQNLTDAVDILDPNQPLRTVIDNGGETTGFDVTLRGRQCSVLGGDIRRTSRIVSAYKLRDTVTTTAWVPLMSIRKKATYPQGSGLNNTVRASLVSFTPATDAPVLTRVTFDDTIGSPGNENFVDPEGWGAASAIEVDKGPGDLGLVAGYPAPYELFEAAGKTGSSGVGSNDQTEKTSAPISDTTIITFWARKIAAADNDPSVSITAEWSEDH